MKKKRLPVWLQKLLLAAYFVFGGTFTFYLTVDRVRDDPYLYAGCAAAAIALDTLFFKNLFSLMHRRELPNVFSGLGKLFSAVFRGVARLAERISDAVHKEKTIVEGKSERTFVFETHTGGAERRRRRLPKLARDANERERIRYEYTVYVFKRDKNIPASLTPNEVERRLDETGEDHAVFERYNGARYDA
ncbi:MAG: hypothetical protein IJV98_06410 [Clostridia bacterium]|nr:hypothetical protein [Clostridia bacterium]